MSRILNGILALILLAGLTLMLYPTISDYSNKIHQTRSVAVYAESVREIDTEAIEADLAAAGEYNERLAKAADRNVFAQEHAEEYENILNISDSGIMGYIDIPQIKTTLPIYHGTEESVLQIAAGHLEWTSLPIGGEGTHSVLSGHRGLPSAKLFTDLDLMKEGDIFTVHIYDRILYYQVDQITVVLPEETEELLPTEGEDYCTLLTCTPYGVNTHRLLVRGSRIYPAENLKEVEADISEISPALVAGILSGIWLILLAAVSAAGKMKQKRKGDKHAETP